MKMFTGLFFSPSRLGLNLYRHFMCTSFMTDFWKQIKMKMEKGSNSTTKFVEIIFLNFEAITLCSVQFIQPFVQHQELVFKFEYFCINWKLPVRWRIWCMRVCSTSLIYKKKKHLHFRFFFEKIIFTDPAVKHSIIIH